MSWEGYHEALCESGHMSRFGEWDDPRDLHIYCGYEENPDHNCDEYTPRCMQIVHGEICGKKLIFWNTVDETNGLDEETGRSPGEIDYVLENEAEVETCNLGHRHLVEPRRYKIPDVKRN